MSFEINHFWKNYKILQKTYDRHKYHFQVQCFSSFVYISHFICTKINFMSSIDQTTYHYIEHKVLVHLQFKESFENLNQYVRLLDVVNIF